MTAVYNEIDPFAAQWLRNLIAAGHIAPGIVDERSIEDIHPEELREFTQVHFFAGIGVWSLALRRVGWPDDRPVWTGSCPCQPFSSAGKGAGFDDERHLWPAFHHLISECRPPVVFGEQVAGKAGREWLSLVRADLEGVDYAVGAADLCAAGVGAPHIRQRLFWVADSLHSRWAERWPSTGIGQAARGSITSGMAHSSPGLEVQCIEPARQECATVERGGEARGMVYAAGEQMGVPGCPRVKGRSYWFPADWLPCRDGKWRPVEPGSFPLAHGAPSRVGRLRAYGNAVVAQCAETFIEAYLETRVMS